MKTADCTTLAGKVLSGYQGWFTTHEDNSGLNTWFHWTTDGKQVNPQQGIKFELYPDVREYDRLYDIRFAPLGDGRSAQLFSSYDAQTVDTHFRWMQEYGIDGVGLQRFVTIMDSMSAHFDQIVRHVQRAAQTYGRVWYLEYDLTGAQDDGFLATMQHDFQRLRQEMDVTGGRYLHHESKPVVELWGMGVAGSCAVSPETCLATVRWFQQQGCYVIGGVPSDWRVCRYYDCAPGYDAVFAACDMLNPWEVGRYKTIPAAQEHFAQVTAGDLTVCAARGQAYMPCLYTGFSWSLWNGGPHNEIPRLSGRFFWEQVKLAVAGQPTALFVAMFDEYDEATAIAKAATDCSMLPNQDFYFATYSADGEFLSEDFYLRLVGAAGQVLRGERPLTDTVPIPRTTGAVRLRTSFEAGMEVPAAPMEKPLRLEAFDGGLTVTIEEAARTRRTALRLDGDCTAQSDFSFLCLQRLHIVVDSPLQVRWYAYAAQGDAAAVTLEAVASDGTCGVLNASAEPAADGWQRFTAVLPSEMQGKQLEALAVARSRSAFSGTLRVYLDDVCVCSVSSANENAEGA